MPLARRRTTAWQLTASRDIATRSEDADPCPAVASAAAGAAATRLAALRDAAAAGLAGQLAALVRCADETFDELLAEVSETDVKLGGLAEQLARVIRLLDECEQAPTRPLRGVPRRSAAVGAALPAVVREQQNLFAPETRGAIQADYERASPPPPLHLLDRFSHRGACKLKYSNPKLFVEEWCRTEEKRLSRIESAVGSLQQRAKAVRCASRGKSPRHKVTLPPCAASATPGAAEIPPVDPPGFLSQSEEAPCAVEQDIQPEVPAKPPLPKQYQMLLRIGLSKEAVRHKMVQDGESDPDQYFSDGEDLAPEEKADPRTQATDASDSPHAAEVMHTPTLGPEYAKFQRMLRIGLGEDAVRHAMVQAGVDPLPLLPGGPSAHGAASELEPSSTQGYQAIEAASGAGNPKAPVAEAAPVRPAANPQLAKYQRMLQIGLAEEAVRQCMMRDGVSPEEMFGCPEGAQPTTAETMPQATGEAETPTSVPRPQSGENPLLAAIQRGATLRTVTSSDCERPKSRELGNPLFADIKGGAARLRRASSSRSNQAASEESSSTPDGDSSDASAGDDDGGGGLSGVAAILARRVELMSRNHAGSTQDESDSGSDWDSD